MHKYRTWLDGAGSVYISLARGTFVFTVLDGVVFPVISTSQIHESTSLSGRADSIIRPSLTNMRQHRRYTVLFLEPQTGAGQITFDRAPARRDIEYRGIQRQKIDHTEVRDLRRNNDVHTRTCGS